jgi:hypothetical protein
MAAPAGKVLPDTNKAPSYLITCGIFNVLAIGLCAARIYSRLRPKLLMRVEDYLIVIPMVIIFCRLTSLKP